jgi:hypothetical protein
MRPSGPFSATKRAAGALTEAASGATDALSFPKRGRC